MNYTRNIIVDMTLVECIITNTSPEIKIFYWWFTSPNEITEIPYEDISDHEKASLKFKGELKSPDVLVVTYIIDDKILETFTWHRINK